MPEPAPVPARPSGGRRPGRVPTRPADVTSLVASPGSRTPRKARPRACGAGRGEPVGDVVHAAVEREILGRVVGQPDVVIIDVRIVARARIVGILRAAAPPREG